MSHRSHPQIITFKGAEPNFFSMTRGNLIHALKFDPVINSDAPLYESRFFIPFNAGVYIRDIKFSNLLILSYIAASKKSTKMFYYCSITSFSRNSMLPSLPISM